MPIGNELYASLRNELLSLSCPALTNSVFPVLEVVETLTDSEPSKNKTCNRLELSIGQETRDRSLKNMSKMKKFRSLWGVQQLLYSRVLQLTIIVDPTNPITSQIIDDDFVFKDKICQKTMMLGLSSHKRTSQRDCLKYTTQLIQPSECRHIIRIAKEQKNFQQKAQAKSRCLERIATNEGKLLENQVLLLFTLSCC